MNFIRFFLIIFFLSFNANSNENIVVRYIDIEFIFKNSSIGKKISKDLNEENKKNLENNKKKETKLQKQKNDILSKKNNLDEKQFEELVVAHQKDVENYQIEAKKINSSINKKYLEKNINLKKKIDDILIKYSKEKNIDVILKKQSILVSNSNLDITKDILELINKN